MYVPDNCSSQNSGEKHTHTHTHIYIYIHIYVTYIYIYIRVKTTKSIYIILCTITLRIFLVRTLSVWQVILFRETGVVHRITYSFVSFFTCFIYSIYS